MQDRWDAGLERCRTGGMQDGRDEVRRDAGLERCRTGVMQDGRDAA